MNANLTKYLTEVFRNEVEEKSTLKSAIHETTTPHLNDRKLNQFLIDGKYTQRLDEII